MYENLNPHEYFRMFGTLTEAHMRELLDKEVNSPDLSAVRVHVEEAKAGLPEEDFLEDLTQRLGALTKKLRGDNRKDAQALVEYASDLHQRVFNQGDYGRSEIKLALNHLNGVK